MKNNWMKAAGISLGMYMAFHFAPTFVNANDTGKEKPFDMEINILNEKEGKANVLDVQIDNIPVAGDLKVQVPAEGPDSVKDSEIGEVQQNNNALVTVELSNSQSLIEDVNLSVLESSKIQSEDATASGSSLASVGLDTSLTEDVELDVLLSDEQSTNDTSSYDGVVVELNGENLPVLGETHVGVLDGHVQMDNEGASYSTGLLQADLDDGLLDDTSIDVLAENGYANNEGKYVENNGVSLNIGNEPIRNIAVDILTSKAYQSAAVIDSPAGLDEEVLVSTPDESVQLPASSEESDASTPIEKTGTDGANSAIPSGSMDGVPTDTDGNIPGIDENVIAPTEVGDDQALDDNGNKSGLTEDISDRAGFVINVGTGDAEWEPQSLIGTDTGSTLPQTGGLLDSVLLTLITLCLLAGGIGIRRVSH